MHGLGPPNTPFYYHSNRVPFGVLIPIATNLDIEITEITKIAKIRTSGNLGTQTPKSEIREVPDTMRFSDSKTTTTWICGNRPFGGRQRGPNIDPILDPISGPLQMLYLSESAWYDAKQGVHPGSQDWTHFRPIFGVKYPILDPFWTPISTVRVH